MVIEHGSTRFGPRGSINDLIISSVILSLVQSPVWTDCGFSWCKNGARGGGRV